MLNFSHYSRFIEFKNKNILAIDFGLKVTGTALFMPGKDPFPYPFIKIIFVDYPQLLTALKSIIEDESIDIIVLGVPYFLDGKESETTKLIKKFGISLKNEHPSLLFFEQDETLTTKAAEERMQNSPQYNFKIDPTKIDCVAASIILEDFIRQNP
jgi:putative Holliday junction resolvase